MSALTSVTKEFDARHESEDAPRLTVNHLVIFSDGASRDPDPLGALFEPSPNPFQRFSIICQYWTTTAEKLEKEADLIERGEWNALARHGFRDNLEGLARSRVRVFRRRAEEARKKARDAAAERDAHHRDGHPRYEPKPARERVPSREHLTNHDRLKAIEEKLAAATAEAKPEPEAGPKTTKKTTAKKKAK